MHALRPYAALAALIGVIAVNAAANIVPINGYQTGQLSDLNPTGFTPAGYVFSIWSLIYLWLFVFAFAAARGADDVQARAAAVVPLFLLNAVGNAGWIVLWHYRLVEASFAAMLMILVTLVLVLRRLRARGAPTRRQFFMVDAPFSLYAGWITTATLANLGAVFFTQQAYPFALAMDQWALVTVTAAVAIYYWVGLATRDVVFCAVFVWAAIGIALNPDGISQPVQIIAATGAAVVAILIAWLAVRRAVHRAVRKAT